MSKVEAEREAMARPGSRACAIIKHPQTGRLVVDVQDDPRTVGWSVLQQEPPTEGTFVVLVPLAVAQASE